MRHIALLFNYCKARSYVPIIPKKNISKDVGLVLYRFHYLDLDFFKERLALENVFHAPFGSLHFEELEST